MIRLEVQDWGCGFEPGAVLQEAALGEHIGLREMQERIELVGGQFIVSSQPGLGTLLVAEVPLQPSPVERSILHEQ
jgi:signal transduction histidine kinase